MAHDAMNFYSIKRHHKMAQDVMNLHESIWHHKLTLAFINVQLTHDIMNLQHKTTQNYLGAYDIKRSHDLTH